MNKLKTPWSQLDKVNTPLSEYPRPQFQRDSYLCLNGPWTYGISDEQNNIPLTGIINVPFSPESQLSGVSVTLKPHQYLKYERQVALPSQFNQGIVVLHFGAVDQKATVYINDNPVLHHEGGFLPFSCDITSFITNDSFKLSLIVTDSTDKGDGQRGKQKLEPNGIFYTPQSGIWQSVWLESMPCNHLESVRITPLFDEYAFRFECQVKGTGSINITAEIDNQTVATITSLTPSFTLTPSIVQTWTPEQPKLYHFTITYEQDVVHTYSALRHFERKLDKDGVMRFYLNHEPYLMIGVLDQGYWPDGLLTAPSDEALIFDIVKMKELGFNTLRKHIKVESLRFYYHCDRLGMIVWQDMINGGSSRSIIPNGVLAMLGIHLPDCLYHFFGRHRSHSRLQFQHELIEMINLLSNVPSIAVWTPFNEAWGQFDAIRVVKTIKSIDTTRLIDHASGWSDQGVSDFYSRHIYFTKIRLSQRKATKRIMALTECGGYALKVNNHLYDESKAFGYKMMIDQSSLMKRLQYLYEKELIPHIAKGLSAIIYTQLSDVENEVNGLLTYDRKVVKVAIEEMQQLNHNLRQIFINWTKK